MKKIKLSVFVLGFIFTTSQAQNIMPPEPTISSISNYINASASPATGVPNIGFPLYQLETSSQNFSINLGLSYHVYNAKPDVPASEVGLGWSFFTSGTISREVGGSDIDEVKDWMDVNKDEADTYYYNIPGYSGKFQIYKDDTSGNLIVNNISGEKVKIEFERTTSSNRLIINSFKIIDDKGLSYLFQDYNLGLSSKSGNSFNYKTSFALSKVIDANGVEMANYTYDKRIKYLGTSSTMKYQYSKINTIFTYKGKIKFDYTYDASYDNVEESLQNDPYSLGSFSILDNSNRLVSKYQFEYSGIMLPAVSINSLGLMSETTAVKKTLNRLIRLDKNFAPVEETSFLYETQRSDTQYGYYNDGNYGNYICKDDAGQFVNPKKYVEGLLKRITFPTKGYVEYDFEANTEYQDKSTLDFFGAQTISDPEIQYYDLNEIPFDTNNGTTYQFQVNGTGTTPRKIYVVRALLEIYDVYDTHGNFVPISHSIKRNSDNTFMQPITSGCQPSYLYSLPPGTYTINIGKGGGNGSFRIYEIKTLPKPYKNENPIKVGARVKSIRSFDGDGTMVKTKKFEYNSFSNPLDATGYFFYDTCLSNSPFEGVILYKNVKETELAGSENNGYTKYYYKTPDDYGTLGSYPFFNITSHGMLEKKEVYNKQNQMVESSDYEYTMQEMPDSQIYSSCVLTHPGWLQYTKEINKTYLNQVPYQTVSETTFSPDNFKEMYSKITAQDGSVSEVTTRYATDLGNTRFTNKNIISTPLEIETKTDGIVMTKATTKYDNTVHFFPTSIEKTDLMQVPENQITFDLYDDKGNLVQVTDKAGKSVTTIWGYYKTLPIAQIVGVKYNDISSLSVVTAAINASNLDADNPANEAALLTALNNLRLASQLQGYSMTVYSYDPLVGVTNSISSNGIKKSYEYDASGRLLKVKNSLGQILNENQYNYTH